VAEEDRGNFVHFYILYTLIEDGDNDIDIDGGTDGNCRKES
jgi:hypothetical protein